ncbi:lipopolysaccharide biosynthesis protein [Oleiharenicola sp. Vm1]|uniref:lipopolysaccharide biosynthesis protein n=1 Tax=Oleiharenicola sp. Vm1 TaxID=3398393 RepID=UPI0039F589B5
MRPARSWSSATADACRRAPWNAPMRSALQRLWPSLGEHRSAEQRREGAIVRTLVSVYAVKVATVTSNFLVIPLAAGYLGLEKYGLWLSAASLMSVLALSDFGLGNNLTTALAQARGRGDTQGVAHAVSATLWSVAGVAGLLFIGFSVVHRFVDWAHFFNATDPMVAREAPRVALLVGAISALQLVTGLTQRIYAGLQEGYWASVWQGAGVVAGLLALLAGIHFRGEPFVLIAMLGLVPVAVQGVGLAVVLRRPELGELLRPAALHRRDITAVLSGSALMFVVNLQAVFWLSKDSLLIAQTLGLSEVGAYNTAFRIFQSVFMLLAGSLGATLWPAYADAFARGDRAWIRRSIARSLKVGGGAMASFALLFVPFGGKLVAWYAGAGLALPVLPLALLGLYFVVLAGVNLLSFPLMGAGHVAVIAWGGLCGGLLSVPLAYALMPRGGVAALVAINLGCNALFQLLPLIWKNRRLGNI